MFEMVGSIAGIFPGNRQEEVSLFWAIRDGQGHGNGWLELTAGCTDVLVYPKTATHTLQHTVAPSHKVVNLLSAVPGLHEARIPTVTSW